MYNALLKIIFDTSGIFSALAGMNPALAEMASALAGMDPALAEMVSALAGMNLA